MNKISNTDPKALLSPFRTFNAKAQVSNPHDKMFNLLFISKPEDYSKPARRVEDKKEIVKDVYLEKREFAEEFSEITTEPTYNVNKNAKV